MLGPLGLCCRGADTCPATPLAAADTSTHLSLADPPPCWSYSPMRACEPLDTSRRPASGIPWLSVDL